MFIIPAAGLAKALMVVTISLHPGAHAPASYTVHQGDTLSAIAARAYGNPADWPAIWQANRSQVPDPDMITPGQRLRLPASGHVTAGTARAAQAAIPAPPQAPAPAPAQAQAPAPAQAPAQAASDQDSDTPAAPAPAPAAQAHPAPAPAAPAPAPAPAAAGGTNWTAIAACESGGNWSANTGNGFYGGLQFTSQTWLAYGGGQYASTASQASPSQQIAVAQRVLAGQGIGAWPVCGAGR